MEISIVANITEQIVDGLWRLLPQLSSSAGMPDKKYLEDMINSGSTTLFIAKEGDTIVGTLSLAVYATPSGKKAWIEDVITDQRMRGKGIGRHLVERALAYARENGLKKVDLTSGNTRIAAQRLYQKLGFHKRETSVFRIELN